MSCCPTDQTSVVSDYQPKGEWVAKDDLPKGDLPLYVSRPAEGKPKAAVVVAYDIFGICPQVQQVRWGMVGTWGDAGG